MRIGFLSEICRQSRALISAKKWRVWEEFLNWHFLENKNAHDLQYSGFRDVMDYIWAKFKQNRLLTCGRENSKMFDFY